MIWQQVVICKKKSEDVSVCQSRNFGNCVLYWSELLSALTIRSVDWTSCFELLFNNIFILAVGYIVLQPAGRESEGQTTRIWKIVAKYWDKNCLGFSAMTTDNGRKIIRRY